MKWIKRKIAGYLNRHYEELDNREYIREYVYFIALAVLFFLILALITYNPEDPSSFSINSTWLGTPSNVLGAAGAFVSEWLYQLFGLGALLFSIVFFAEVLSTFRTPPSKDRFLLKLFGFPQLIFFLLGLMSCILEMIKIHSTFLYTGGALGHFVATKATALFGSTGAIIALLFGSFASLILCLGLRPLTLSFSLAKLRHIRKRRKDPLFKEELIIPSVEESFDHNENLISLLKKPQEEELAEDLNLSLLTSEARNIEEKLATFDVRGAVIKSIPGPVVNIHEFEPAPGVKVSKVLSYQDDLALALKAESLMIDLHYGKSTLSIEVPAFTRKTVYLRSLLESADLNTATLPLIIGQKNDASPLIADLADMPHLLIAGSTGSGKSVFINTILLSLLMHLPPERLRLILVDPKILELSSYDGIGHLLSPVITEPKQALFVLEWLVEEMDRRYLLMKEVGVRNIHSLNKSHADALPYLVVVIDELSDLMLSSGRALEQVIQKLSQKSRAAGIHLILATQRPSVDVITGVIKANLPSRISFKVVSKHDSRTIIETSGAERLLGKGDLLALFSGQSQLIRAQCAYVSDEEMLALTNKLKKMHPISYSGELSEYVQARFEKEERFAESPSIV